MQQSTGSLARVQLTDTRAQPTRRLTDSSSFAFGRLRLAAMATRRSTRRQRTGHTARRQHQISHEGGSCGSLQRRRNATLTSASWLSRGAFLIGFPLRDLATLMAWRTTLASAPSLHARKNARTHSLAHAHTHVCVCVRARANAVRRWGWRASRTYVPATGWLSGMLPTPIGRDPNVRFRLVASVSDVPLKRM
jgi:hypothetical protein